VNSNIDYLKDHFEKNDREFTKKLNFWSSKNLLEQKIFQISHNTLNEKYRDMKRSYNSYCKKDFIDYNFLVDEIILMSQTYNPKFSLIAEEEKKHQDHIKNLLKNNER